MKVMFLVFCAVVGAVGALKCHQGADATAAAESTACADDHADATKCSGPNFVEYTGYVKADQPYACGACNSVSTDCKDCEGPDGCNAPLSETHTFKCTEFTYDSATTAFKAGATATECKALKATKAKCNSNGESADAAYVVKNKGCGPCLADDVTSKKCVECEGDNCNSAATITAFILPIIALIYTLF